MDNQDIKKQETTEPTDLSSPSNRKPISDPKSVIAATHDTDEAVAHEPPPFDRGQAREKIQP